MKERSGMVTFQGNPMTLLGEGMSIGAKAPDFSVLDNGLKPVSLSGFAGKTLILASVLSLDTSV